MKSEDVIAASIRWTASCSQMSPYGHYRMPILCRVNLKPGTGGVPGAGARPGSEKPLDSSNGRVTFPSVPNYPPQ